MLYCPSFLREKAMAKKKRLRKLIRNPFARIVRSPVFSRRVQKDKRERMLAKWMKDEANA